jgi:hypothetical protein
VIQNNQKVTQLYRASILEDPQLLSDREFILVADDFEGEIEFYYNQDTLTSCSGCEDGFLNTIRESIENISFKTSDYQAGVQTWKDAWAMLMGGESRSPNRDRDEAEADREYLLSERIVSDDADIIQDAMRRFGEAFSSSDPQENAQTQRQVQTTPERRSFEETLLEAERNEEGDIPFRAITDVNTQIEEEEVISQSIQALYEAQLPHAFAQDVQAQEVYARIIRMHFELVRTINLF